MSGWEFDTICFLGIFATYSFITDRAETEFSISAEQTSLLLSTMGACSTLARLGFGPALDRFRGRATELTSAVLLTNAAAVLAAQFSPSFGGQLACAVLFGLSIGAYDTSIIVIFKQFTKDITHPLGVR